DYDGDGRQDLFVTGIDGTILYRNRGDGTFEDVTARTQARVPGWSSAALFVDLDEDGFLDLYVVRYLDYHPAHNPPCYSSGIHNYCTPHDFAPLSDVILRNERGERFVDATSRLAPGLTSAPGLMVAPGDFDGDGRLDLYVANDEVANFLLVDHGRGHFADEALLAGVGVGSSGYPEAGMGVDVGDVDGDRLLDIVVGNFADQPVNYFRNLGRGVFAEESARAGIYRATYHPLQFGVRLFDADNDADLDLFVCNGHIWDTVASFQPGTVFPQQNLVLRNQGDGTFADLSSRSGSGLLLVRASRGVASGDLDRDGDLDLVYVNQDSPVVLLRNDGGNANPWVRVELRGRPPNTGAVGARVELHSGGGQVQLRQVTMAGGYQSSNEPVLHFGLGPAGHAERLVVHWPPPRRVTTEHSPVVAGQLILIRQP
ncbi:MAG: CRTAC1 family protein, partial [Deltaproteobacteria bacterium]|nr:CRTAC1 family protein [Deltaproteobacteria bacterium]